MTLYHGTSSKNVSAILVEGLRPNKIGIVYLSPKPEVAARFGVYWPDSKKLPDLTDSVVLEVETGDLRLTAFDDCEEWEVLCWGHVPATCIRVHSQGQEHARAFSQRIHPSGQFSSSLAKDEVVEPTH